MAKRLIWTDEELNSYGFRVLTSGIDLTRFEKNPVMLFNHHRTLYGKKDEILPIGIWKNYGAGEGGIMSGEPVFDKKDDFAAKIADKVEGGFLKACSIGIRIIEVSEAPEHLKPGQTRATVTKCELREVSIVDIPSNPNAAGIVLYDDNDRVIELSDERECPVRLIHKQTNHKPMKEIALKLGLPENAGDAEVLSAITRLQESHKQEIAALQAAKEKAESEVKRLSEEKAAGEKAEASAQVEQAIKEGKIPADLKETYLKQFETDFANTRKILGSMPARQSLRGKIADGGESESLAKMSWDEIDRSGRLSELKEKYPDLYERKYKEMCSTLNIQNS